VALWLLFATAHAQISHVTTFDGYSFNQTLTKVVTVDGTGFTKFNLPAYPVNAIPGEPELPVKYVRLIIPPDQDIAELTIKTEELETHYISNPVYPIQNPAPVGEDSEGFVTPNPGIYNSDNPYPTEVVKLVNTGYFNGNTQIATFAVYPYQYYPNSKKIIEYSSITFSFETEKKTKDANLPLAPNKDNVAFYNSLLKNMVDNPEDIGKYSVETTKSTAKTGLPYYEYVIITSSTLSSSFNDFIVWKRLKGINIGLVTYQDIRTNYPSGDLTSGINDIPGSIRQYLMDAWQQGTTYCLLGGDMNTLPGRYGCGEWDTWHYFGDDDYQDHIPTDLYFSDLNGDWDVDNDIYIGEPDDKPTEPYNTGDNVDYEPEIFVGRLLCATSVDIQTWFQKVKKYENNPGNGDFGYLGKVLFTEADEIGGSTQQQQIYWETQFTFLHELNSGNDPNPTYPNGSDVISTANNLYGFMSWFNHGGANSVSMMTSGLNNYSLSVISCKDDWDIFHNDPDIIESGNGFDNLTNFNHPSIVYTTSCDNNPFDDFGTDVGYFNMAEGFTTKFNGGGPAYLGNSRYGLTDYAPCLMSAFLQSIQTEPGYIEPPYSLQLGVSEAISKEIYPQHYVCLSHNLIGCPEIPFWRNTPQTMYLSVDYTNNRIRILTQSGSPLCYAKVSFNYGGTYYFEETDYYGYANAPYDLTEAHEVGASYPGYLPVYTQHVTNYPYWSEANPIRGNVFVESGKSITMVGNLTIPKYSKLIIEDNATVTLYSTFILNLEGDIELRVLIQN